MKSRRVQMAFGAGLAAFLLWLFFRGLDFGEVLAELRHADYRWVVLAVVLTQVVNVQRAWRWHYLLLPIKSVRLAPLIATTYMGWAFTSLLPGRLGEVARPVLLGRRENISKSAAFATIVLERLFDLLTILLILVTYLLFFPLPATLDGEGRAIIAGMRASGFVALAALAFAVAFLTGAQLAPRRTDRLLVRLTGWLPGTVGERLLPLLRSFLAGFAGIRDPRLTAIIVIHSLLIWGNILVTYWGLLFAFDIELPFYAVMPLVVMVVIGVMVPTPAGVGGFHLAVELALVDLFGIAAGPAASYALVCHAVVFIPITLI
ncbi:MAG: lysylphosphatidylglycerol synthase transmembrane domain-containing protein, partial [Acidobacteriota bacterium]